MESTLYHGTMSLKQMIGRKPIIYRSTEIIYEVLTSKRFKL
jgi:hypothetical protein